MNRWKVIAVVLVIWGLGLFMLEQATHRRLEMRLAKLQKDNQDMQKTVDAMMVTINQLRIVAKNTRNDRAATNAVVAGQALSVADILALKTAFDDIQGEVAAGKLKPLALTDAYQRMQKVLNSPTVGAFQSKGGEAPPSK